MKLTEKVIQFGEGGFLRGFFDWMVKKLNDSTDFGGSVIIVQPIKEGLCDLIAERGFVYTHLIRGAEGFEQEKIDVISRCSKPYDDFEGYLSLADIKSVRFIVSNTTEAGIVFDPKDRWEDGADVSFPAKLTRLLYRRYQLGLPGYILLPCELIDRNGDKLLECVLKYASLWELGDGFCSFVRNDNVFTNTLVDRINTGYPKGEDTGIEDPLLNTSEFFHLWVIETQADIESEIPFSKAGLNVIITKDALEKYRTRKVRILNGAHTSLVPYAMLSGFDTVKSCIDDEKMRAHIEGCIFEEIIPTLDLPRDELEEYARSVITRFSNPYVKHYLSSISLNSVSKFRVRVLPSILEYIRRFGSIPKRLVFSFAMLIKFYKEGTPNDLPEVTDFMRSSSPQQILSSLALWGEDLSFLSEEVKKWL